MPQPDPTNPFPKASAKAAENAGKNKRQHTLYASIVVMILLAVGVSVSGYYLQKKAERLAEERRFKELIEEENARIEQEEALIKQTAERWKVPFEAANKAILDYKKGSEFYHVDDGMFKAIHDASNLKNYNIDAVGLRGALKILDLVMQDKKAWGESIDLSNKIMLTSSVIEDKSEKNELVNIAKVREEFKRNELAAKEKYLLKCISFNARVESVKASKWNTPILIVGQEYQTYATCEVPFYWAKPVMKMGTGSQVRVTGLVADFDAYNGVMVTIAKVD